MRQAEQEVGIAVEEVRRDAAAERRRAAGEGEARRGDFVVVHVQAMHVDAELDVVRALGPAGVHHPLPLRIEVVETDAVLSFTRMPLPYELHDGG